ncbi:MAG: YdcH family protein [Flavobacteriales bacterium]
MEKHDLLHEFPQYREKIHDLKTQNAHFRKLFDDYHKTDHHIHRIESGAEIAIDEHLNKLRTHRVFLKDQLYNLLQQ